jgi:hypothetical protein
VLGTPSFFSLRGGTHLSASLPGSLAASDALGSARSGFEATPVVDADHGKSKSHRRRRRGQLQALRDPRSILVGEW